MSERRVIKLAEEVDELHRENAQLREALRRIRSWCPNQPTKHPADAAFTRIIHETRKALGDTPKE